MTLINRAKELISIASLTPFGENQSEKLCYCNQALNYLESILLNMGAFTKRMSFSGDHDKWFYEVPNLYAEIVIGNPTADSNFLVYMGHIDVAPIGQESAWSLNPFKAVEKDGYIYGRGATDMKSSITTFITSVENILNSESLKNKDCRIGFIITADEEWAGVNGSKKVLEWMKQENKKPNAFIVGEPSASDYLEDSIKVGRRGSLIGSIEIKSVQGHRAYPSLYENPNRVFSFIALLFHGLTWEDGNKYLPNTDFEIVSINSGRENVTNVIPGYLKATWGVRYTAYTNKYDIDQKLKNALDNIPEYLKQSPDYELFKKFKDNNQILITSNMSTASEPYFSPPNLLAKSASNAIEKLFNKKPFFDSYGGTTDARFVNQFFEKAEIIELGVPEHGGIVNNKKPSDYNQKGGMHQIDERVAIQDIINLEKIYTQTIINFI